MERYSGIIATLQDIQTKAGETDRAFAARIGITHTMWINLRTGAQQPGRRTLEKIGQAFPGLQKAISSALFLASDSKNMVEVTMNDEVPA
jgi:transcriptional regulator with XRE-family HTH domain